LIEEERAMTQVKSTTAFAAPAKRLEEGAAPAAAGGTLTLGGDLTVRRLGFGSMQLTGKGVWGEPADHDAAIAVLQRAVELGVDFIDTADAYGPEVAERLIAEALHPYPAGLVIATKAGFERPGPGQWVENGRPEHLRAACEGSLRRLKVDRIDQLQLHRIDPKVPVADQIGALVELQRSGKIRHIGLSEVKVEQIETVRRMASVVSVQNKYSLAERGSEKVLDYCTCQEIAFIPWYPLDTGKLPKSGGPLGRVAKGLGATPAQVALAWLLGKSPMMLPIAGTSKVAHLEENIAAAALRLDQETMETLEALR
jgi:pyridoxine 4-dehydrogenase